MRQFSLVLFLVLACATLGFGQRKTYFASGQQCVEALQNGTAIFYLPKANNLFKEIDPRTEVKTELEEDECIQMIVDRSKNMRDFYWIAQPKGTAMVKEKGGLTILRRYSCGNPTGERMHVPVNPNPQPTPTPTPQPTPTPIVEPCRSTPSTERKMVNGKMATVVTDASCHTSTVYDEEVRYQATCPTVTDAEYGHKGYLNRLPSVTEWILGPGKAILIAGVGSNQDRGKAMITSGIASTIDTVAVSWLYPDYNVLTLQTSIGPMTVQKGKNVFSVQTTDFGLVTLEWKKDSQITMRSRQGVCFAGAVQKGMQTGSDAIVFREGNGSSRTIPIKTETVTPNGFPSSTTSGNCPLGASTCTATNTVPDRPIRTSFADETQTVPNSNNNSNFGNSYVPSQPTSQASCPVGTLFLKMQDGSTVCAKP